MKINKKNLNTFIIIIFFILMENIFYLVDTNNFKFFGIIWFALFIVYYIYKAIKLNIMKSKTKMYFLSDIISFFGITVIASLQSWDLIGQPIKMGFISQKNFAIIMLSYIPIRLIFSRKQFSKDLFEKFFCITGIISIIIFLVQIILYDKVNFIYASQNKYQVRLYVDSIFCVFIAFIGMNKYLKTANKKYLIYIVLTLIYEIFISKGRLELIALISSLMAGILLLKKKNNKKIFLIILAFIAFVYFINSPYADRFYEAIASINSNDKNVNTMYVRFGARELYKEQLFKDITNLVLGCGYPNINDYEGARISTQYYLGYKIIDNGIFAYVYVYGIIGLLVFVKWFYKLYKLSWILYKKNQEYKYIMFMIFITILLYNITFWWWRPSWIFIMVILMSMMEFELYDKNKEENDERIFKNDFEINIKYSDKNM